MAGKTTRLVYPAEFHRTKNYVDIASLPPEMQQTMQDERIRRAKVAMVTKPTYPKKEK